MRNLPFPQWFRQQCRRAIPCFTPLAALAVLFYGSLEPATSSYAADELKAFSSALDSLSGTRMLADIETLSGLEYEGRQTGTSGDIKAAGFVSRRFASLGLRVTPLSFSASDLPAEPGTAIPTVIYSIGNSPRLEVLSSKYRRTGQVPTDYLPILDSPSLNIEAPVAFVGYGISDPERRYDDYAGLNVRDHVVLFLRGKPDHYPAQISHAEKVRIAREKGAMAYLTVTGPLLSAYESRRGMTTTPSAFYGRHGGDQSLAGAWITPAFADLILAGSSEDDFSLHSLQETMNRSRRPASRLTASSVHMVWEAGQRPGTLYNVIAMLPGSDPKLRDQPVILGAHRDHFGHQAGQTFPGADDNASGTAVILEVARALAEMNPSKRTVVFVSFSGEEQGMVGSQFYV
ncbi:MAG TPA: M28 family peptidase, partial [Nitrospira sp.]